MQAADDAIDGSLLPRLSKAASASTRTRRPSSSRQDGILYKPATTTMSKALRGGYKTPDNGETTGWSETRRLRSEDIASFHIELAECVETKTVTTTTTTKRSYPPLLVQPPRPLEILDSKQYPLARKPTPCEIASFTYEVDGETVHFREDRRPSETLETSPSAGRSKMQSASQSQTISSIGDLEPSKRIKPSRSPSEVISIFETARSRVTKRHAAKPISPNSFQHQPDATQRSNKGASCALGTYLHETSLRGGSNREFQDEEHSFEVPSPTYTTTQNSFPSAVATPPIAESDLEPFAPLPEPLIDTSALRPTTSAAASHGASLPSPGLSPTLAAANLHSQDLGQESALQNILTSPFVGSLQRGVSSTVAMKEDKTGVDLNAMLDSFDSMPAEMKTFMMYQFLRRCNKKTLHVIAGVVNPALKCDFLDSLPIELSLHILSFLDMADLCKAAQVSKRWRSIVDTNETGWKELLIRDKFVLPAGELELAIAHGWGWQDPYGPDACERNISERPESPKEDERSTKHSRKRKMGKVPDAPKKNFHKRRAVSDAKDRPRYVGAQFDSFAEEVEGPNAAAAKAAIAVPAPNTGLPSLRQLHLYKSLYRRRFMLKRSWMMSETVAPKHVAFPAHPRHVITCLQFDDDKIITGSDDTYIHVYDTKSGALRKRLEGHEGGVWALQYEGNVLVSGSTDRSVRVWDIGRGVCTQVFHGHTSTVRCLQIVMPTDTGVTSKGKRVFAPEKPLIITGSRDAQLKVWRLPESRSKPWLPPTVPVHETECPYYVRTLSGHTSSVRAIAAHQDTLVSGSYDNTVRVWKISTGEIVHQLRGHIQKVYSVVLDHKRNRCISGSMDNTVRIWDLETGNCKWTLEGHTSLVGLLDLKDDRLVSAAADSTLRIWDPESGSCKNTLTAHTGAITCFQHDGQKVISGSDRTLKMWNVKTGECMQDLLTDLSGVWQVKFDERRCVAAVQRDGLTFVEVLDFGASRDGISAHERGRRILLDPSDVDRIPDEDDLQA